MISQSFDSNTRPLIRFAIFSSVLLCQIGINIENFPVTLHLLMYFGFSVFLINERGFCFGFNAAFAFLIFALAGIVGVYTSGADASYSSLFLLLALYWPFLIRQRPNGQDDSFLHLSYFLVDLIVFVSGIALVQYFLTNFLRVSWLGNISEYIPDQIHSAGVFNYLREAEQGVKANGFFLKEPSFLSMYASLCLVFEFYTRRSFKKMLLLAGGLIASMSGTGILILLVSLVFPSRKNLEIKLVLIFGLMILISYMIDSGADGNPWLSRISEFSTEGTSGYARFVAPIGMINGDLDDLRLFGSGAGSYTRVVTSLGMSYEIHDPTWVKLIYEYGLFGFCVIFIMVFVFIKKSSSSFSFKAALLYAWLFSGGLLLNPEFILMLWVFGLSANKARGTNV